MMISPESYYETYLKGKSQQEILKEIRSLKRENNQLKKKIEEQLPDSDQYIMPSRLTRFKCNREYLDRAILAYEEAGGKYLPTKQEQKSLKFDCALENLYRFKFSIGGFCGGYETRTYTVTDDNVMLDVENTHILKPSNLPVYFPFTKEEFVEGLKDLHMGEWKKDYTELLILDGTQWELEIQYTNGRRPVRISGSNAYPYNFEDLLEFLEIDF